MVSPITAIMEVNETKAPLLDLKYFRPSEAESLSITLRVSLKRPEDYLCKEVLLHLMLYLNENLFVYK